MGVVCITNGKERDVGFYSEDRDATQTGGDGKKQKARVKGVCITKG